MWTSLTLYQMFLRKKVVLYKRLRRFGKTLNMSMLYYFFSNQEKQNSYLFNGLSIASDNKAMNCQNRYPVIYLSLKDVKNSTLSLEIDKFRSIISKLIIDQFNDYQVKSNRESGNGRFDLCIVPDSILDTAVIIECKHSNSVSLLRTDAKKGAEQIENNQYRKDMINDGYSDVIGYGISFYKKQCYVVQSK